MKKIGSLILKTTVSVLLFLLILSYVDKELFMSSFRSVSYAFLPIIALLIVANYVVSSFRWKALLIEKNSEKIKVSYLVNLYFIGSFFNNFMPTSMGGDVFKIYALGKKIKSTATAFSSVFMERFSGVVALVLISYFGLVKTLNFWVSILPEPIKSSDFLILVFKVVLFFGFWLCTLVGYLSLKFLAGKINIFNKIYTSLIAYKDRKDVLGSALATSFVVQFVAILTQYCVFLALGISLPIWHSLLVFPIVTLAGFIIPSLNGVGVQDVLYMQMFSVVGVPPEVSLSASILYHFFRLFVSLFGGVLYALGKDQ